MRRCRRPRTPYVFFHFHYPGDRHLLANQHIHLPRLRRVDLHVTRACRKVRRPCEHEGDDKAAEDDATDVIAVGKRGLGRLSRLLLGSVSPKVVALAPCAVIVVP